MQNTMSKNNYIYNSTFWCVISLILYHNILFRSINEYSYFFSKVIFYVLVIGFNILGMAVTSRRRNRLSIFVNVMFPIWVMSIISYYQYTPLVVLSGIVMSIILSFVYAIFVFKTVKRIAFKSKVIHWFFASRLISTCIMTIFVVYLVIGLIFGAFIFSPSINAEAGRECAEKFTIEDNIETITNLEKARWNDLSSSQKLNTLQTVANIERYYLGLPNELNIKISNLPEHTLACYNDNKHLICIDTDHFENDPPKAICNSLLHESFHSYSYRLCELYDSAPKDKKDLLVFRQVKDYKKEFLNYSNGSSDNDGFQKYYNQRSEADARAYAKAGTEDYYKKIALYLKKGGN